MSTKKKTPEELAAEKLAAEALVAEQAGDKVVDTSATEGETAQPADAVAETPAVDNAPETVTAEPETVTAEPETVTAEPFEPILGEIYEYQNQVGTLQNMFTGQEFAAGAWEKAEHDNFLAGQIQAGRLKIRP